MAEVPRTSICNEVQWRSHVQRQLCIADEVSDETFVRASYSDLVVVDIRDLNKVSGKDNLNGRYALSIEKSPEICKEKYPPCHFELWYCYNSRKIEVENIFH